MYQQELNNVNNITAGDIENRIKSKSSHSKSNSLSSTAVTISEQQQSRDQSLDKPKEKLTLLTSIPLDSSASSVTMSKDGFRVFVGGKGRVEIVSSLSERKNKESIDFSPLQYVRSCKLFRDETTIVVSGEGAGIHLFDLTRGMKKLTLSTLDSNVNYSLSLAGDDSTVFATLLKGTIGMWDLRSSQLVRLFDGHSSPCSSIDLDPSGKVLMSGGLDKTVKMWDINSGKCFQEFQTNSRVLSLTNSPASDLIVYGLEDGGLDLVTYKTQSNSHNVIKHSDCVLTTKFSPKGNYIISGAKGGMLTISGVDACFRQLASERLSNSVLSCDVVSSTDGDYISVGTWDNKISLYKLVGV
ncbi:predicted protein [Naegleria gruberi]|uniref:Predicted protein n=1 Tax=Naegleria gruberi TaxID=5762 RepID=D2V0S9_NAEGR|nr:uncharacterized protein NAEGRDRAFT_62402 [Naegleria gruberi]EFC49783.1 predicted protein [Naegleria gruberi]|eukprot:XP_002682527.1 predicted protein [Naegleria gruberi strain NEG-M]